jgi:hypothetical protein
MNVFQAADSFQLFTGARRAADRARRVGGQPSDRSEPIRSAVATSFGTTDASTSPRVYWVPAPE